jgi:hypothetical protein
VLDKVMIFAGYPVMFIAAFLSTLLGYGIIGHGKPDRGDEAALEKKLRMLRWLGPALMVGIALMAVLTLTGVFKDAR